MQLKPDFMDSFLPNVIAERNKANIAYTPRLAVVAVVVVVNATEVTN